MDLNRRDAGLVRAVGPWGLAASTICSVVGAGIFVVPAALAAAIGPYAPVALLVCAVSIGSIAICFAEGGSRIPSSGGAYGYIEAAFGAMAGFVAGTILCVSNVLATGGLAVGIADDMVSLLPPSIRVPAHLLIIIAVIGGIAFVNAGGVTRGIGLINAAMLLKLAPLAIFICVGVTAVHTGNLFPSTELKTEGLGRALILALFTFTGMEVSLCASGEVTQPARTIPRALVAALVSVTLIYVAIQMVAQGILGPSLATSSVPLADAMARISPALRLLMLAGAAVSMFGYISCDVLGTPRMLFAFARDGFLPSALGRLHERSHAPYIAIYFYAAVAIALAASGTFSELVVLSTLAVAVLYIAGCLAAWRLTKQGVAQAGPPLNFRWLRPAMIVGIGSMVLLIALGSREEIIGLFVLVGVSVGIYFVRTRMGSLN